MITVYKLVNGSYEVAAQVYETDATVKGTDEFADELRAMFEYMERDGFDPTNHMDTIRTRLEDNYRNGYYHVT